MRFLGPTPSRRLNEAVGFVCLVAGLLLALALASYHPLDPSWDTASAAVRPLNLIGRAGATIADLCYQLFGLVAAVLPFLLWVLGWKWMRSEEISAPLIRVTGAAALVLSISTALDLTISWRPWGGAISCGGLAGTLAGDWLVSLANPLGAILLAFATAILSLYLISSFSMLSLERWFAGPIGAARAIAARYTAWRLRRREAAKEREALRRAKRAQERAEKLEARKRRRAEPAALPQQAPTADTPPWQEQAPVPEPAREPEPEPEEAAEEIPIHVLEDLRPAAAPPPPAPEPPPAPLRAPESAPARPAQYRLPPTDLLNEVPARNPHDSVELKEIAARIKSKFEEFNVLGSVVQINPGPVVTTFEYKPEAGVKYSKITALSEDLCLGLQAESILIERIPGKPTVGIEVPNSRREVISLRQILESEEFDQSASKLTVCLGKDISGRIKVASLESMPHLLIAGSTGSGKSVMLNTLIMSILYKSTPDDVRLILVDPKRVELGIYEGIPHLLTPVITDAKKATNALRNAVLEMERRLKLLASIGVRNIDQFNRKVRQMQSRPLSLFEEENTEPDLAPLPYILILIDELADLMMLERGNVEEAVTRLAQMARAVGMHLVLATQRPSVDVITGLIKANFPSRISFRVATRVDSRTVLDVMGAEHLLGKGDMLFLPPGSSRLTRVHGAFVTEAEITEVVEFWKAQARPEYDQTFLLAPPSEEEPAEDDEAELFDGEQDPMYQDAVRVVLEMGKASTSTLQRRLRLGYGRAARILDMMHRDGIIGPPDGSKPREVLKRPDWLEEVESGLR
jgi:S-DNA-T family DNA segregation ATPase FtsK/SpoIIIE